MTSGVAVRVSTRASGGVYSDTSGPVLAELLRSAGCETDGPVVIPDGAAVEATLREAVTSGYDIVVTTGGTGLTPGELTPGRAGPGIDKGSSGIREGVRAARGD